MRVILALLALAMLTGPSLAGSKYDWRSGNMYNWNSTPGGDTNVQGYNLNNGSTWRQTIKPDGSMNGFDSGGNYWKYDSGSGNYQNFGTGEMCVGKGAARTCF